MPIPIAAMRDDLRTREPGSERARLEQGARRVLADERRDRRAERPGVGAAFKAFLGRATRPGAPSTPAIEPRGRQ